MKSFYFLLFTFFAFTTLSAQEEQEAIRDNDPGRLQVKTSKLFGKLIDSRSMKGLDAASAQLYIVRGAGLEDSLVRGMLTKSNGDFLFTGIPADSFRLVFSALGYEEMEIRLSLSAGSNADPRFFEKDLGNLLLMPAVKELGNVVVTASRPAMELGVDRKIFNASRSMVATGGTAVDLMKNIPSVSVDVEGNVQLRNSTPQIFVDGRPTILTLDQIPADNIDKVELITNPSARFDAASSGGIINIVLKKNKRIGLNGIATIGAGVPHIANGNLNLNMREGKFNFFLSGGYNQSGGKARSETMRQNKSGGAITDYFNQYSANDRRRRFTSLRFGMDYFLDNRNTISVTQNIGRGRFSYEEEQHQDFLNSGRELTYYGERFAEGASRFNRNSTALNFTHKFPQEGKELRADLNYNYGKNSGSSSINNFFFNPDGSEYQVPSLVDNSNNGKNRQLTFQADYVNPLNERAKIEGGIRSYHNEVGSVFNAFADNNGAPLKLPLSNNYEYKERINALYVTYSNKNKKETFSYQVGLRAEHSKFDGLLVDSAFKFGYQYPKNFRSIWDALFPSLFLTQKLGEDDELQFNYSRRIRRPNFWQINPFVDINDPANIRQGNPALRPEFINSFEINYSKNYQGGNFLGVLYWRNNPDDITEYSDTITAAQYEQLKNAGINPDAILNTFINASTTNRYGAEFTVQHKWSENFDITPTINLQYRKVNANIDGMDLSNQGFNWEAKLTTNYKIKAANERSVFNGLGFQVLGEYESAEVIPQGRRKPQYSVDFAMRKDLLKEKGTLTFSVNDVFNTNRFGTVYDTDRFYQDAYRRWNVRTFRVTFSYRFGKADFSLLRRNNDQGRGED